jgi:RNA recognition motif-containing protein
MNIYIGNLNEKIQDAHLKDAFKEYGQVIKAKVIVDRFSGSSKGFGFIEMPNEVEAAKAIKTLNGGIWEGNVIKVNQAFK